MVLPEGPEREFQQELREFELEKQMPHITSIERFGIEKGREEGREEGRAEGAANLAIRQARKRFTAFGPKDEAAIRKLNLAGLEDLSEALLDFAVIADLRKWLADKRRRRE